MGGSRRGSGWSRTAALGRGQGDQLLRDFWPHSSAWTVPGLDPLCVQLRGRGRHSGALNPATEANALPAQCRSEPPEQGPRTAVSLDVCRDRGCSFLSFLVISRLCFGLLGGDILVQICPVCGRGTCAGPLEPPSRAHLSQRVQGCGVALPLDCRPQRGAMPSWVWASDSKDCSVSGTGTSLLISQGVGPATARLAGTGCWGSPPF